MDNRSEFENARNFLIRYRDDYEYVHRNFEWPNLAEFNWALDYFDVMAQNNSGIALWQVGENGLEKKYSFSEMSARSNQVANYLRSRGLKKGDTVFLLVDDDPVLWEIMLGAMKLGLVMIPNDFHLNDEELSRRVASQRINVLISSSQYCEKFNVVGDQVVCISVGSAEENWSNYDEVYYENIYFEPDEKTLVTDPLFKYFTTGPHARDNVILHTYGSFTIGHLSTMYWMGIRPGDVHLSISSTGWAQHIWSSFIAPWNAEATVFVFKRRRFDAGVVLRTLENYPINSFLAPPVVWSRLCEYDLNDYEVNLRELLSTGDTLPPEIIGEVYRAWGKFIRNAYSLTETPVFIGVPPETEGAYGSLGMEMPGFKISLRDAEGNRVDHGEICVDASSGLWGVDKSLELKDGWFYTGDFAYEDDRGHYNYSERDDGVFNTSGYKVSPLEIERVLKDHPLVRDALVIPSPDPKKDMVPKAYITLIKGQSPSPKLAKDILDFSKSRVSSFKRIRRIEFCDIPRDTEGKIPRKEMVRKEITKYREKNRSTYEFWEEDFKINIDNNWTQEFP